MNLQQVIEKDGDVVGQRSIAGEGFSSMLNHRSKDTLDFNGVCTMCQSKL
jgi:hypothetical protein